MPRRFCRWRELGFSGATCFRVGRRLGRQDVPQRGVKKGSSAAARVIDVGAPARAWKKQCLDSLQGFLGDDWRSKGTT